MYRQTRFSLPVLGEYMYSNIMILFVALFSMSTYAIDVPTEEFVETGFSFNGFDEGQMTLPVVLIYDKAGKIKHSFVGKDINRLSSYQNLFKKPEQTRVSSADMATIANLINHQTDDKSWTLIYLGMDICPPCYTMLDTFNKRIKPNIEDEFDIISINMVNE